MVFSWIWLAAQAKSGVAPAPVAPQNGVANGVEPAADGPANDNAADLWEVATANYSASERADLSALDKLSLVSAFQAVLSGREAPRRAAVSASAQLSRLKLAIANGASTELNPF